MFDEQKKMNLELLGKRFIYKMFNYCIYMLACLNNVYRIWSIHYHEGNCVSFAEGFGQSYPEVRKTSYYRPVYVVFKFSITRSTSVE